MPMEASACPHCGSPVAGRNYKPVGGVRRATDLDMEFGRLGISFSFSFYKSGNIQNMSSELVTIFMSTIIRFLNLAT